MKRNVLLITAISVSAILASCSGGAEKKMEESSSADAAASVESTEAVAASNWMVDAENSTIRWEGGTTGAQVYSHYGMIKIKDGSVTTEGDKIAAGSFMVDMTSIEPTDENYSEEHPASDLVGHLTTDDFFATEQFPTARFEITGMSDNKVMGNLTIRDQTHEEAIEITSTSMEGDVMKAAGTLVFDRQKYNVAWEHYLKDVILSDDITLEISLTAKKDDMQS